MISQTNVNVYRLRKRKRQKLYKMKKAPEFGCFLYYNDKLITSE